MHLDGSVSPMDASLLSTVSSFRRMSSCSICSCLRCEVEMGPFRTEFGGEGGMTAGAEDFAFWPAAFSAAMNSSTTSDGASAYVKEQGQHC